MSLAQTQTQLTESLLMTMFAGLAFGGTGLCSYRVRGVGAVVQSILL